MSNNEFYEHKKSDAVKWIIVFVLIGVLFAGRDAADENDDILLLALNMHWEPHPQQLPTPPKGLFWQLVLHTGAADPFAAGPLNALSMQMGPRSAAVFRLVPTDGGI